jgi:flavoprotein
MDWQHMIKAVTPRLDWALTGSGHFFNECIEIARQLEHVDLFVSKAAGEVLRQYKQTLDLPKSARLYKDTAASSPQVGYFYHWGVPHARRGARNLECRCQIRLPDFG